MPANLHEYFHCSSIVTHKFSLVLGHLATLHFSLGSYIFRSYSCASSFRFRSCAFQGIFRFIRTSYFMHCVLFANFLHLFLVLNSSVQVISCWVVAHQLLFYWSAQVLVHSDLPKIMCKVRSFSGPSCFVEDSSRFLTPIFRFILRAYFNQVLFSSSIVRNN